MSARDEPVKARAAARGRVRSCRSPQCSVDSARPRASAAPSLTLSTFVLALAPQQNLPPLGQGERFALDLLLDLSRVLRVDGDADGSVVRLRVVGDAAPADVAGHRARDWGIAAADGEVMVERSLLSLVRDLAGAVVEQRSAAADRYGRVPPGENAMVRAGQERDPVVSDIALALGDAVRRAAGARPVRFLAPWPGGRRWAAALTHDLDVVEWWPAFTALRLAELARKGEIGQVARVIGAVVASAGRDVVWRGVQGVLKAEARHGVRSSWFILCGTPSLSTARAGDLTYRPESAKARRILGALRHAGHEIGLHGSFATSDDHALFLEQRARLAALAGVSPEGVRQHYLRMRPGATQRGMSDAGFSYDSTFGFSDRNGFRLGTADVVPAWDEAGQTALPLDEAPFTWMDRALSKYRGVEQPEAWIDDAFELADRCRAVQGMWSGIWHPNLTPALGFPGAPAAYERLVAGLVEREAWVAPLGEIVAWRRARRAARAAGIAPDGRVRLVWPESTQEGMELALEDGAGNRLETNAGA